MMLIASISSALFTAIFVLLECKMKGSDRIILIFMVLLGSIIFTHISCMIYLYSIVDSDRQNPIVIETTYEVEPIKSELPYVVTADSEGRAVVFKEVSKNDVTIERRIQLTRGDSNVFIVRSIDPEAHILRVFWPFKVVDNFYKDIVHKELVVTDDTAIYYNK